MFCRGFFLVLFFACSAMYGQSVPRDTIYLMNGHVVTAQITDTSAGKVTLVNPDKPAQKIDYDPDQLYMVSFSGGGKKYFYDKDTLTNNWLTREEMWMYMKGENDARKGFKAKGATIGSAIAGLAGGMTGSFWGPVAPYGFMALSGLPKVKIKRSTVSDPENLKSEAYLMGYERVARQKLKTRSLIGGTAGLVAGYAVYILANEYYPSSINFGFNK